MKYKYTLLVLLPILIISCSFKTKTELYLERGLDVLNNVKEVNFNLIDNYCIKKIGVIRDEKQKKKTLVIMLSPFTEEKLVNNYSLGIQIVFNNNGKKVVEQWDIKPNIKTVKGFSYIIKEIPYLSVNKIQKASIYLYDRKKFERKIGNNLEINNLFTNND